MKSFFEKTAFFHTWGNSNKFDRNIGSQNLALFNFVKIDMGNKSADYILLVILHQYIVLFLSQLEGNNGILRNRMKLLLEFAMQYSERNGFLRPIHNCRYLTRTSKPSCGSLFKIFSFKSFQSLALHPFLLIEPS